MLNCAGGTPPFYYSQSSPITTNQNNVLAVSSGSYVAYGVDSNACTVRRAVTIATAPSSPLAMSLVTGKLFYLLSVSYYLCFIVKATQTSCPNGAATANVSVSGGKTYRVFRVDSGNWSDYYSIAEQSHTVALTGGGHVIYAKDASGCTVSTSVTIIQPSGMIEGLKNEKGNKI